MNYQRRITVLSRELAKIDADFRANFDYSRDATDLEIDAQLARKDHIYKKRSADLLAKLVLAEDSPAPSLVDRIVDKVTGAPSGSAKTQFKAATPAAQPIAHKVDFDGRPSQS